MPKDLDKMIERALEEALDLAPLASQPEVAYRSGARRGERRPRSATKRTKRPEARLRA